MKKTYIIPCSSVYNIHLTAMLAGSPGQATGAGDNYTAGENQGNIGTGETDENCARQQNGSSIWSNEW